ncbi:1344_t:CDS:2, partial [Gigaspora margarita]
DGFAKYQLADNDFKIIHWKYFYPFNKPQVEFSIGDIIMFTSKFVIKNLEQHVTVFYTNVIVARDSNHEFEANKILISISHFSKFVSRITLDFVIFEVTDIDFMTSNVNVVQDVQLIIDKLVAPFQDPEPSTNISTDMVQIQKNKNKLSDLALNFLELLTMNSAQDRRVQVKDGLKDDNEFEMLEESVIEEVSKKNKDNFLIDTNASSIDTNISSVDANTSSIYSNASSIDAN